MKTAHFLFTMVGCLVLTQGIGHAAPSGAAPAQSPSGSPNPTVGDHQPGSSPPAGAVRGASVGNKTVNHPMVRSQGAVSLNTPLPKNVSNRGPGPGVIGGPAGSTKSTVAINGSNMNRKR